MFFIYFFLVFVCFSPLFKTEPTVEYTGCSHPGWLCVPSSFEPQEIRINCSLADEIKKNATVDLFKLNLPESTKTLSISDCEILNLDFHLPATNVHLKRLSVTKVVILNLFKSEFNYCPQDMIFEDVESLEINESHMFSNVHSEDLIFRRVRINKIPIDTFTNIEALSTFVWDHVNITVTLRTLTFNITLQNEGVLRVVNSTFRTIEESAVLVSGGKAEIVSNSIDQLNYNSLYIKSQRFYFVNNIVRDVASQHSVYIESSNSLISSNIFQRVQSNMFQYDIPTTQHGRCPLVIADHTHVVQDNIIQVPEYNLIAKYTPGHANCPHLFFVRNNHINCSCRALESLRKEGMESEEFISSNICIGCAVSLKSYEKDCKEEKTLKKLCSRSDKLYNNYYFLTIISLFIFLI